MEVSVAVICLVMIWFTQLALEGPHLQEKYYSNKTLTVNIMRGLWMCFFFYMGFLSRTLRIQSTAGEGGGYFYSLHKQVAGLEPGTFVFWAQVASH